jgi:hypothetical protein
MTAAAMSNNNRACAQEISNPEMPQGLQVLAGEGE